MHDIARATNHGYFSTYIDLTKAFDSIPHKVIKTVIRTFAKNPSDLITLIKDQCSSLGLTINDKKSARWQADSL
ncbi:hypothetical protein HZS_5505 [Henneguya salminicola]|nr:hypothetical protein HZS_5505 [Henneguya salminicola]